MPNSSIQLWLQWWQVAPSKFLLPSTSIMWDLHPYSPCLHHQFPFRWVIRISILGFEVSPPICGCWITWLGFKVSPPICRYWVVWLGFEVSPPICRYWVIWLGFEVSPPICRYWVVWLGFEVSPPISRHWVIWLGFEVSLPICRYWVVWLGFEVSPTVMDVGWFSYGLKCLVGQIWDCDVVAVKCLLYSRASVSWWEWWA